MAGGQSNGMDYTFEGCYGLETISVPLTVIVGGVHTRMEIYTGFLMVSLPPQQDYALKFVVIPTGDKFYVQSPQVQGLYQLECLCIADSHSWGYEDTPVTVFGTSFSPYLSLRVIDLRKCTAGVLSLGIIPSSAKLWPMAGGKPMQVKVPTALVDQYKADSSWSAYADYIVGV